MQARVQVVADRLAGRKIDPLLAQQQLGDLAASAVETVGGLLRELTYRYARVAGALAVGFWPIRLAIRAAF